MALFTLFFLLGSAAFSYIFFVATRQGQILGKWYVLQESFGEKSGFKNELIYKIMGGCEFCYSWWMSFIFGIVYIVTLKILGFWFNIDGLFLNTIISFFWYLLYVSICTVLSLLLIIRK